MNSTGCGTSSSASGEGGASGDFHDLRSGQENGDTQTTDAAAHLLPDGQWWYDTQNSVAVGDLLPVLRSGQLRYDTQKGLAAAHLLPDGQVEHDTQTIRAVGDLLPVLRSGQAHRDTHNHNAAAHLLPDGQDGHDTQKFAAVGDLRNKHTRQGKHMSKFSDMVAAQQDDTPADAASSILTKLKVSSEARAVLLPVVINAIATLRRGKVRHIERVVAGVAVVIDDDAPEMTRHEARMKLARETFITAEGECVRWGQATVAQHISRIGLLRRQAHGIETTIDLHAEAVADIERHGVTCLDDIRVVA